MFLNAKNERDNEILRRIDIFVETRGVNCEITIFFKTEIWYTRDADIYYIGAAFFGGFELKYIYVKMNGHKSPDDIYYKTKKQGASK